MSSLGIAVAGIEASAAPYVEAVTFRVEGNRVQTYLTMTDDVNAPPSPALSRCCRALPRGSTPRSAPAAAVCVCACRSTITRTAGASPRMTRDHRRLSGSRRKSALMFKSFKLIVEGEDFVIVNMSEAASNVSLDALASPDEWRLDRAARGQGGNVLAVLRLSNPAAQDAANGELTLNEIREGIAPVTGGRPATARILSRNDEEVFVCDIGGENSDAVIKLNTTQIHRNSPVRIRSFTLAMP